MNPKAAKRKLRFLVTAGPTREFIDPVRFISNRSSGKMGYALAAAARRISPYVTLVSGPTCLKSPRGVKFVSVTTAEEMAKAVFAYFSKTDVVIMAAAVAYFRPRKTAHLKIKKKKGLIIASSLAFLFIFSPRSFFKRAFLFSFFII